MGDRFKVYAQVRATRQLAGDVANETKVDEKTGRKTGTKDREKWQEIETLLNNVECMLEHMNLKEPEFEF